MWNRASIKDFWEHNTSDFAGDTNASEILRLTKRYCNGRVLDVGAGSGALISLIPDAVGLDIIPRKNIVQGSIDSLEFPDGSFNTVYATDVLEHLEDDTLIGGISEVNRVLTKGGKFIIIVPYRENIEKGMVYCPNCCHYFHRWGHLRSFDETISLGGFKIKEIQIIPLSLMAKSFIVRYFWRVFVFLKWIQLTDMLVVAEK